MAHGSLDCEGHISLMAHGSLKSCTKPAEPFVMAHAAAGAAQGLGGAHMLFSKGIYFLLIKIVVFRVSWISRYIVRVRFVFKCCPACPANKVYR